MPTKRGQLEVASHTNISNKKIKTTSSSLVVPASHQIFNGEHLSKLWERPMLPSKHIFQDIGSRITSSRKRLTNWTSLNVCSLSTKSNQELLPEDLEGEILARLPVQSLLRFRCVSKSWSALIKSPTFIKRHLGQQKKGSVLLIKRWCKQREDKDVFSFHNPDSLNLEELQPDLSIPFLKDLTLLFGVKISSYAPARVSVLGPCNGLVCVTHFESFIFCNPSLREFKLLPACPYAPPAYYKQRYEGQGFGVSSNGDFKVVLIRAGLHEGESPYVLFYVYNSRINSWRKVDCDPTLVAKNAYEPVDHVFFKGACHWYARDFRMRVDFSDFILSFDINTEVIGRLELPDCLATMDWPCEQFLWNLNGCLALAQYPPEYGSSFELWVMKEYGLKESWTKQYSFRHNNLHQPLLPWRNGDCGECLLSTMSNGQLACFASDPCRMKRFDIHGERNTFRALLYEESLISVNKLSSSEEGLVETVKKPRTVSLDFLGKDGSAADSAQRPAVGILFSEWWKAMLARWNEMFSFE